MKAWVPVVALALVIAFGSTGFQGAAAIETKDHTCAAPAAHGHANLSGEQPHCTSTDGSTGSPAHSSPGHGVCCLSCNSLLSGGPSFQHFSPVLSLPGRPILLTSAVLPDPLLRPPAA